MNPEILIAIVVFAAVSVAAIYDYINKKALGGFIRALFEQKAFSPQDAKKFSELGVAKSDAIRRSLDKGALKHTVLYSEETGGYYIPEERLSKAELFSRRVTPAQLFAMILLAAILGVIFYIFTPEVEKLITKLS